MFKALLKFILRREAYSCQRLCDDLYTESRRGNAPDSVVSPEEKEVRGAQEELLLQVIHLLTCKNSEAFIQWLRRTTIHELRTREARRAQGGIDKGIRSELEWRLAESRLELARLKVELAQLLLFKAGVLEHERGEKT